MTDTTLASLLSSEIPDAVLMGIESAYSERNFQSIDLILPHVDSPNKDVSRKAKLVAGELLRILLLAAGHKFNFEYFAQKARMLKKIRPDIGEQFIKDIAVANSLARSAKLKVLAVIEKEAAEKILNGAHFDTDPQFRATAVKLFREINGSESQSRVMKFLSDAEPRVVSNALETLESMRNQNLLGIFARFRNNSDPRIKSVTLRALCQLGEKNLHDDIKSFIENGSERYHSALAWLLPDIQLVISDPLPIIEKFLKSSSGVVKSSAIRSLKKIGSSAALKILSNVSGLDLIAKEDEAREKLHGAVFEKEGRKRVLVIRQAAPLLSSSALSSLTPFVTDPEAKVIVAALNAIGSAQGNSISEIVAHKYTASPDPRIRASALKIMHQSGQHNATQDIVKMLSDKNERMRAAGVTLIGELGPKDIYLCELLIYVANDKSRLVQKYVLKAKKKIIDQYKAGIFTIREVIVQQAGKMVTENGTSSMPREKLHQVVAEALKVKSSAVAVHTLELSKTALCTITTDSFGMEIINFPEKDALDLFLYFCENVRYGKTANWEHFSSGAMSVLQNITYLSQKHGRMVENKTAFPIKELDNCELPKGINVTEAIREILNQGLSESIEEEEGTVLLFQRNRIQKFINALKWLPVFKKLIVDRM
jgi:HEAT repeat protein